MGAVRRRPRSIRPMSAIHDSTLKEQVPPRLGSLQSAFPRSWERSVSRRLTRFGGPVRLFRAYWARRTPSGVPLTPRHRAPSDANIRVKAGSRRIVVRRRGPLVRLRRTVSLGRLHHPHERVGLGFGPRCLLPARPVTPAASSRAGLLPLSKTKARQTRFAVSTDPWGTVPVPSVLLPICPRDCSFEQL